MTDVRTFRAATMQDALDLVREELGADAVILHTRQVETRRFLRRPVEQVEITASVSFNAAIGAQTESRRQSSRQAASPAQSPGQPPVPRTRRREQPATERAPAPRRLDVVSEPGSLAELLAPSRRGATSAPGVATRNRQRISRPIAPPLGHTTMGEEVDPTAALTRRLDAIQQMLRELGRNATTGRNDEVPGEIFDIYTELIDAEVDEAVARELVFRLKRTASPRQLADASAAQALLAAMVESDIRCCEPIAARPGRRRVVALVGATGVGKTTTVAKLAANFRLRGGMKMGLVTVDTYRVAAVEQLRTYAEIIDLPMKVVTNPVEMRRALDDLAGLDLVLIDTAGRSPKDDVQINELKSLLAEARVDEVHLVLSMTSSLRALEASATNFAAAGTTSLILTKLDEASGMGTLYSVARRIPLPISYLTAGQDVPDDIEPAHPARIARLILGRERPNR